MKWSQIKLRGDTSLWVVFFLLCVISVIAVRLIYVYENSYVKAI